MKLEYKTYGKDISEDLDEVNKILKKTVWADYGRDYEKIYYNLWQSSGRKRFSI